MADSSILPIGNGGAWGPRALEILKDVEQRQQSGPLVDTQKSEPAEHQRILNPSGTPARRQAALDPRDQCDFSTEALAVMERAGECSGRAYAGDAPKPATTPNWWGALWARGSEAVGA